MGFTREILILDQSREGRISDKYGGNEYPNTGLKNRTVSGKPVTDGGIEVSSHQRINRVYKVGRG